MHLLMLPESLLIVALARLECSILMHMPIQTLRARQQATNRHTGVD